MSFVKNTLKELIRPVVRTHFDPIIVASMGRSGSTLIYDSIAAGLMKTRFGMSGSRGNGLFQGYAWDLSKAKLERGIVYKTHDFAANLPRLPTLRAVFVFGLASDAALSVLSCQQRFGDEWLREHMSHMHATGSFQQVATHDVMRFSEQLDDWTSATHIPILALNYDHFWDERTTSILSRFVGFPVKIAPRRPRFDDHKSQDMVYLVRQTYNALDERIRTLDPIFTNSLATSLLDSASA